MAVKAEQKCGSGTSELRYSRQSGSAETELQIFNSHLRLSRSPEAEIHIFERTGRADVRKWNSTFLAVKAERGCGSETSYLYSQVRAEGRKRNLRSLAVKAEQKCGSGTLHIWKCGSVNSCLWQSRHSESETSDVWKSRESGGAEAEHQIFEGLSLHIRQHKNKLNFVEIHNNNIHWNLGSITSHIRRSMQSRSAEAELQILGVLESAEVENQVFGSQGRAELRKRNLRSLVVKTERTCGSRTSVLW